MRGWRGGWGGVGVKSRSVNLSEFYQLKAIEACEQYMASESLQRLRSPLRPVLYCQPAFVYASSHRHQHRAGI